MRAVDTNILVRFIVRDDVRQFAKASAFFNQRTSDDPAFVSLIVLAEFVWVLKHRYGYSRHDVHSLVASLVETAEIVFEDELSVLAIVQGDAKGDLADHLISICAKRAGCTSTVTFDRDAAKFVPDMELLA